MAPTRETPPGATAAGRVTFSAPGAPRTAPRPRLRTRAPVAIAGVLLALPLVAAGPADEAGPQPGDGVAPVAATAEPFVAVEPAVAAPTPPDATPRAPVAVTTTTLPRSRPTHVRIPVIGVDSELVGLGLDDDGRMEVPPGAFPAGWYTGAPTPGELGPAVLAGHVDHSGELGVFHRLRELVAGDAVEVERQDGTLATFRVVRVEQHRKDAFPTAAVYGDIDHAGLRLITCGGPFDRGAGSYEDNVVVFAELVVAPQAQADDVPERGAGPADSPPGDGQVVSVR